MNGALPETNFIYEKLLSDEQKGYIKAFLDEIETKKEKYETQVLWLMDQKIGGIGGYCMPADPKKNPFPGGLERELFRPLQYARSEIDVLDVRLHARHVIQYSGMHLEAVMRLFVVSTKLMGKLRFSKSTLGKLAHETKEKNIFDKVLINSLFNFIVLFNKAKHEVNMSDERARLFSVEDAIISYFAARIIGKTVLAEIEYPLSLNTYEINNDPFEF
ncbi:hypothetical protein [Neobacillus niacini]|uniref:hypothetical protein n=1 Tax=Neobacillus niacini TaxID=86668 RepID=UPI0021CB628C|nr:hypothetical protein [Neobacillus niacini]MCM3768129.1 hypothetical protein [Neobacillus niacini]